jgi:predicted amidohydrolase YtcJ
MRRAAAEGIAVLNGYGVTALLDAAVSLDILDALASLDDAGELDAWVVTALPAADPSLGLSPTGLDLIDQAEPFRRRHHRPDFVKLFLDGVPPTYTAAFLEPYPPGDHAGAGGHGMTWFDADQLRGWFEAAFSRGLGVKVHCSGDASARMVLDATEALRPAYPDRPVHLAHGQFIDPADRPRLAALGVVADISPYLWFPGVIPSALVQVLGPERAARLQPNRTLLDLGTLVAAGSDWPVSPVPNPWVAIHGLVNRTNPTGSHPGALWPEQAITLAEAIQVTTANPARAMGLGDETGTLTPGRSADFIQLDRDPFAGDPAELGRTQVVRTWFEGRLVHER